MTTLRALIAAGLVVGLFGVAVAKLPPPAPLTDAQKDEKKAKDAAAAELAKAQQTKAEDRVVAHYFADMKAKGKAVPPPQALPAPAPAAPAAAAPAPAKGTAPAPKK